MIKKLLFTGIVLVILIFLGLKVVGFFDNNQIKLTIGTDEKDELDVGIGTEKIIKQEINENDPIDEKIPEIIEKTCVDNSECAGEKCIDGVCQALVELYETDCVNKCNFNKAEVLTSTGRIVKLNRGQSTYTEAGAIAYKLLSGPDYCQGSEVVVPIEVTKASLGKVLQKQVITVGVGETSEVITHPKIARIQFTVKINSVEEQC
jgi:hypothetical protein